MLAYAAGRSIESVKGQLRVGPDTVRIDADRLDERRDRFGLAVQVIEIHGQCR